MNRRILEFQQLFKSTFVVNMISSANSRCEIDGPMLLILIGFHLLLSTACSIFLDNIFIHRMKIYGDIGSPCRMPLVGEKKGVLISFARIIISLVVMHYIIRFINFCRRLKNYKDSLMKLHYIVSKAFSKSILSCKWDFFPFFSLLGKILPFELLLHYHWFAYALNSSTGTTL